jgi:hypothetical protein
MDAVAADVGWHRYLDLHTPSKGRLNADYLASGFVIELKIIEEEGIEKEQRQRKLAKLLSSVYPQNSEIDIALETTPEHIRREVEKIVSGPIQTAVKKASQQIRETSEDLSRTSDTGAFGADGLIRADTQHSIKRGGGGDYPFVPKLGQ